MRFGRGVALYINRVKFFNGLCLGWKKEEKKAKRDRNFINYYNTIHCRESSSLRRVCILYTFLFQTRIFVFFFFFSKQVNKKYRNISLRYRKYNHCILLFLYIIIYCIYEYVNEKSINRLVYRVHCIFILYCRYVVIFQDQ